MTTAMPVADGHRWTADEVRALPDEPGTRFECVDGELFVSPGPRLPHQSAIVLFTRALDAYCTGKGVGSVFNGPGELELDRYTLVQPDLFVLPLVDGRRAQSQEQAGHPLLFVEVLSPGTARSDRAIKRVRYQRHGVEYWIADMDARLVERWTPEGERPELVSGRITWQPAGAAARSPLISIGSLRRYSGNAEPASSLTFSRRRSAITARGPRSPADPSLFEHALKCLFRAPLRPGFQIRLCQQGGHLLDRRRCDQLVDRNALLFGEHARLRV